MNLSEHIFEEDITIYKTAEPRASTTASTNANAYQPHPTIEHYYRAPEKQSNVSKPAPSNKNMPFIKKTCNCYDKKSDDSRCCGACFICCPSKDNKVRCDFCPSTVTEYCKSGMVYTDNGTVGEKEQECGVFCILCLPLKFSLFFPCLFGSCFNDCINNCRGTNTNYLF